MEKGTLVTIYDAFDRPFRDIDGDEFDKYFLVKDGVEDIIKQTQPQFHKGTRVLNGNRYLVLKTRNDEQINVGSSLEIHGIKFNLMYEGMTKYCFLCSREHGRECPTKVRFEFLKKLRMGKTEKVIMEEKKSKRIP